MYKVYEIKKRIFDDNDQEAEKVRKELKENQTFLLNLMSSPGGGKTTTLKRTIEALKEEMRIGVMEADIDSAVDADTISETGAKVIQLHTGGMCHLDADMTRQGIRALCASEQHDHSACAAGQDDIFSAGENSAFTASAEFDLIVLENIGNLVCPAEFDTGAHKNIMLFSVPEGDDKPLKYPLMFQVCDLVLITKTDTLEYFDFDMALARERIRQLNPGAVILPVSARTGEGMDAVIRWILDCRSQILADNAF